MIRRVLLLCVVLAAVGGLLWSGGVFSGPRELVVYCAHDSMFAESILAEFERQTGIRVIRVFDTEATKSLGLVNKLLQEKNNSRCDVFWNNQLLGTIALHEEGVLAPYRGSGHARIPENYRDPEGYWTGFAARFRVYIVNTEQAPATQEAVDERMQSDDLSRVAIAKPMFGTTLSHYSLLWQEQGGSELKAWHASVRERGLQEASGNATVMNLVAAGKCDLGWTDTDDCFVAIDEGKPVAMLPIRAAGKTICIPNSVAIIRGAKNESDARKLVDFLLSEETELKLARSRARQAPLGPVDPEKLPPEVRELQSWTAEGADLRPLGPARRAVLEWLKTEYVQ